MHLFKATLPAVMAAALLFVSPSIQAQGTDPDQNAINPPETPASGPVVKELGGSQNVLIYEELVLGTSHYQAAVAALGWSSTTVSTGAAFEAQLSGPDVYTHVISAHNNSFGGGVWEDDLEAWAVGHPGAPVLISDWRVNNPQPYLANLGFGYTGNTNPTAFEGSGLLSGLASLYCNPGWGIYGYGVTGGTTIATDGPGGKPVAVQIGSWFFNGFLSDVFCDPDEASAIVQRQLAGIDPAEIPTVSEWGLIVLALLLLLAGTIVIRRTMAVRRVPSTG